MLFLVPGYPGESYWKSMFAERFLYGVLPAVASIILLVIVGWLWNRSSGSPGVVIAISSSVLLAWGAILLFWIVIVVIAARNGSA